MGVAIFEYLAYLDAVTFFMSEAMNLLLKQLILNID